MFIYREKLIMVEVHNKYYAAIKLLEQTETVSMNFSCFISCCVPAPRTVPGTSSKQYHFCVCVWLPSTSFLSVLGDFFQCLERLEVPRMNTHQRQPQPVGPGI